jgi:hypothetical protein
MEVHHMETATEAEVRVITYYVNGETQTTSSHKLTVREILSNAEFTPPENYKLSRNAGHHEYTNYDEEVPLHEGERFTALFQGPTPTS